MNRLVASLLVLFSLLSPVFAQETKTSGNSTPIALGTWYADNDPKPLRIEVLKDAILGDYMLVMKLDEHGQKKTLAKIGDGNHFLGMFPTRDGAGDLVTFWIGGPYYRIVILRKGSSGVVDVLHAASSSMPELIYCFKGTDPLVLITAWDWSIKNGEHRKIPKETAIYRWTGTSYTVAETVAWEERLARASALCAEK